MNDAVAAGRTGLEAAVFDPVPAVRAEFDLPEPGPVLPGDHPAWQRDVLSISSRARALIAALRPFAVRILSFWDHHVREMTLGSRRFSIDPSGSYRLQ